MVRSRNFARLTVTVNYMCIVHAISPNYDRQKIDIDNFVLAYAFAQIINSLVSQSFGTTTFVRFRISFENRHHTKTKEENDHDNAFASVPASELFESKVHSILSTKAIHCSCSAHAVENHRASVEMYLLHSEFPMKASRM